MRAGSCGATTQAVVGASIVWLGLVGAGLALLLDYSTAPGDGGAALERWPAQSSLQRNEAGPTLVLFAHPRCPCTRASIGELNKVMARAQRPVAAYAVFYTPASSPRGWPHTDLWRAASVIPGVRVVADPGGAESLRFKLSTSGHVLVYSADGRLVYSGGVTKTRGHHGDNAFADAVVAALNGQSDLTEGLVYGCSLRGEQASPHGGLQVTAAPRSGDGPDDSARCCASTRSGAPGAQLEGP